jgi:hypothetical protein
MRREIKDFSIHSIAYEKVARCDAGHRGPPHAAKYWHNGEQLIRSERVRRFKRQNLTHGDDAMIKAFYAIIVSAIAAGCVVAFPILSQQVRATAPAPVLAPAAAEAPEAVTSCGQNAWPYLDAGCLRNASGASFQARDVRLVAADRRSGGR